VPRNFVGGVQQIQLRIEGRDNGDLRALAPFSDILLKFQMSEIRILISVAARYIWGCEMATFQFFSLRK
jgi:hypothetical protein